MRKVHTVQSLAQTEALAASLAKAAKPGDVYALIGGLGAGKTAFAKAFASGLSVKEIVNSPTFTILQEYDSGRLPLYHFDMYRIGAPEETEEIGFDDYLYGDGVCLIEWADRVEELLPERWKKITIDREEGSADVGSECRRIIIEEIGV